MKNNKSKKEALIEALLEIVLTVICALLGIGIVTLFGGSLEEIDFDLLTLIGLGIFLLIFIAAAVIFHYVKKKIKKNREEQK